MIEIARVHRLRREAAALRKAGGAAVALAAPLALGLIRKLRLPAVVLEIVLGIAVGPLG